MKIKDIKKDIITNTGKRYYIKNFEGSKNGVIVCFLCVENNSLLFQVLNEVENESEICINSGLLENVVLHVIFPEDEEISEVESIEEVSKIIYKLI